MIRARFAPAAETGLDPVYFDATPWFRTAREHEIVGLVQERWTGKTALRLAYGLRGVPGYGGLARIFAEYAGSRRQPSVRIDCEDAMHWLHFNRRGMFDEAMAADRSDPAMFFGFPVTGFAPLPRRREARLGRESVVLKEPANGEPGLLLPSLPEAYLVEQDGGVRNAEVLAMLDGTLPEPVMARLRERLSGTDHVMEHTDLLFEAGFVAALEDGIPTDAGESASMRAMRRLFSTTSAVTHRHQETAYGIGSWQSGAAMAACLAPPRGTSWTDWKRHADRSLEAAILRLEAAGIRFGDDDDDEMIWMAPMPMEEKIGWLVESASAIAGDFAQAAFLACGAPQETWHSFHERSDFEQFLAHKEREAVFLPLFFEGATLDDLVAVGEREHLKSEEELLAFRRALKSMTPEDAVPYVIEAFSSHLRPQYRALSPDDLRAMVDRAFADHPPYGEMPVPEREMAAAREKFREQRRAQGLGM